MTAVDDGALPVRDFLLGAGLLREGEQARFSHLTGGVSSDLLRVDLPGRTICVKSALPQLNVEREWFAPVSRNRVEHDWLLFAGGVAPGQVPRVLAHDGEAGMFAMEFLPPEENPLWKARLLAGVVDPGAARAVGDLLGRLHAASAGDPEARSRFATDDNFDALRIAPYLRATARAHPDLRARFDALVETTTGTHLAVVHGDVSPKNILLGPAGPVLLDAECAWYGDPAFDLAFCLNHLLLKAVRLPAVAGELATAAAELVDGHRTRRNWEPAEGFELRVGGLLPALSLARVDGLSPVEYLDEAQRHVVRTVSRELLSRPQRPVAEVVDRWFASRAPLQDPAGLSGWSGRPAAGA